MTEADIIKRFQRRAPHFRQWAVGFTTEGPEDLEILYAILDKARSQLDEDSLRGLYHELRAEVMTRRARDGVFMRMPSFADLRTADRLYLPMILRVPWQQIVGRPLDGDGPPPSCKRKNIR